MSKPIVSNQKSFNETKYEKPTLKPIAFAATVFSTVAITSCLITFPLILHFIQTLESNVQLDLDFCKSRARDMWKEMFEIKTNGKQDKSLRMANMVMNRQRLEKRDTISDFWHSRLHDMQLRDDPVVSYGAGNNVKSTSVTYSDGYGSSGRQTLKPSNKNGKTGNSYLTNPNPDGYENEKKDQYKETPSTGCCTCQRGPPGLPGPRGQDGYAGLNGEIGQLGPPGPPAPPGADPVTLFPIQCPCEALQGEPGPKGPAGIDGVVGPTGPSGADGKMGNQGPRGPIGLPGQPGQSGRPGPPGEPGVYVLEIGPPGQPGLSGRPGPPGPIGTAGVPGNDGLSGRTGAEGPPGPPGVSGKSGPIGISGRPGQRGPSGSCDHCPPARLAPGY